MSTHRHINRICCAALVFALLAAALFCGGRRLGIQPASQVRGYESRLFDRTRVHTISIVMDDWDGFLETCENEEYSACALVIDGEAYKNVGLRAKGNTSLSQVSAYGNDRYSFKIKFDHYDTGTTYYGLDKLCLNNIIQDNTYMKDYLAYNLMGEFEVASPLCSYVWITVNNEDWGLYLAVEGVEDAFLTRNYGTNYGNLYKPDSMDMGGSRGGNDREDFRAGGFPDTRAEGEKGIPDGFTPVPEGFPDREGAPPDFENAAPGGRDIMPDMSAAPSPANGGEDGRRGGGMGGMGSSDVKLQYIDDDPDSYSNIFDNAKTDITDSDKTRLIRSLKNLSSGENLENTVDVDKTIRYFVVHNFLCNGDSYTGSMIHNYYLYEENSQLSMIPWDYNLAFGVFDGGFGNRNDFRDRTAETASAEGSPNSFAEPGQGGMETLAMGAFSGATSEVNSPIDSPVTGSIEDRPMIAWIFNNEEYLALYHTYYKEFLDKITQNNALAEEIRTVSAMISEYVEADPTKFCTFEEFETGVDALLQFCELRAESISGQLDGSIPSTSDGQQNSTALVDASAFQISDLGSMNLGIIAGGFNRNRGGNTLENQNANTDNIPDRKEDAFTAIPNRQNTASDGQNTPPAFVDAGGGNDTPSENPAAEETVREFAANAENSSDNVEAVHPQSRSQQIPGMPGRIPAEQQAEQSNALPLLAVSAVVLAAGLWFAWRFNRF